jgi:hypothetical protein
VCLTLAVKIRCTFNKWISHIFRLQARIVFHERVAKGHRIATSILNLIMFYYYTLYRIFSVRFTLISPTNFKLVTSHHVIKKMVSTRSNTNNKIRRTKKLSKRDEMIRKRRALFIEKGFKNGSMWTIHFSDKHFNIRHIKFLRLESVGDKTCAFNEVRINYVPVRGPHGFMHRAVPSTSCDDPEAFHWKDNTVEIPLDYLVQNGNRFVVPEDSMTIIVDSYDSKERFYATRSERQSHSAHMVIS